MKIKYILCVIFLFSLQYNIGAIPWGIIQNGQSILFETVEYEQYGDYAEKKDYVINNQTEWEALWNNSFYWDNDFPLPPLPYVNFSSNTIIGVYLGRKPTGGYLIKVYGIIEKEDIIIVYVKEKEPTGAVSLAITHPFHIVKTMKLAKTIIFIHYIDHSFLINRASFKWTLIFSIITSILEIIGVKLYFKRKQRKHNLEV